MRQDKVYYKDTLAGNIIETADGDCILLTTLTGKSA
tara:strand:+ start:394 stop:501 length:108 start_codon:yes stop_codon:yes gene_type:complete